VEAKVVDLETGKEVPRNSTGELLIRSALVMKEYWNKPDATRQAIDKEGWFRTGDVARIDPDGFIEIVDRAKDIVIRGGENISCVEVESAFMTHPAVRECAVFSLPDKRLGEVVGVMIMLQADAKPNPEQLRDHVKPLLAAFKIPNAKDIFYTRESLPRGATGKTQKRDIRQQILDAAAGNKSKL